MPLCSQPIGPPVGAYFVTDGQDRPMREMMGTLLATQGVDPGDRSVPLGVAWVMATVMETVWQTFRMKGEPPLTRQMLRLVPCRTVAPVKNWDMPLLSLGRKASSRWEQADGLSCTPTAISMKGPLMTSSHRKPWPLGQLPRSALSVASNLPRAR